MKPQKTLQSFNLSFSYLYRFRMYKRLYKPTWMLELILVYIPIFGAGGQMIVQIKKWGNSLAVRIPAKALAVSGLSEGSWLEVNSLKG